MAQRVSTSSSIRGWRGLGHCDTTIDCSSLALSLGSMAEIIPASFSAAQESKAAASAAFRYKENDRLSPHETNRANTLPSLYIQLPPPSPPLHFLPPRALFITRHERTFLGVIDVRGNWAFHVEQGPAPAVSLGTHSEHQVG